MQVIRRRLVVLVFAVLASQVAGMAATPLALLGSHGPASAEAACTCPGGGMTKECPMHKHQASEPSRDTPRCVSPHDNTDVALMTWLGVTGLVVERQQDAVPASASERVVPFSTRPLTFISPPVSPPPRS